MMDLYSVIGTELSSTNNQNCSFHLVQLPNNLVDDLNLHKEENGGEDRNFIKHLLLEKYEYSRDDEYFIKSKSTTESPYLTSFNKTFKIRQQNHSNCVMLIKDACNFKKFNNYLLLEKENKINSSLINLGNLNLNLKNLNLTNIKSVAVSETCLNFSVKSYFSSFKKILVSSNISIFQFENLIIQDLNYLPNFDSLYKYDEDLEIFVLNLIITDFLNLKISKNIEPEPETETETEAEAEAEADIDNDTDKAIDYLNTIELVETVYIKLVKKLNLFKDDDDNNTEHPNYYVLKTLICFILIKYSTVDYKDKDFKIQNELLKFILLPGDYKLNNFKIIKFLTLCILKKNSEILIDDLLIKIRLNLPINYLPNFQINKILNGISFNNKNENGQLIINYLTNSHLINYKNPKERFDKLFNCKKMWLIEEIEPFITPVNFKNIKIDKFCLKYCRVKKIKGKTFLLKR